MRRLALTVLLAVAAISALTATGAAASLAPEPASVIQTLTSWSAVADATVREDLPTTNYGWTSTLDAMVGPDRRGYLLFDVEGLSGPVQRATLSLTVAKGDGGRADIRSVGTAWGGATVTWSNAPPPGGVIASPTMPTSGRVSIDVTPAVAGNGPVAFAIVSPGGRTTVYSSETGPNGPQLTVAATETPTPPANTAPPVLSGTAESGRTLSTTNGEWSGTAPMTYAYAWLRCDAGGTGCQTVAGATSASYQLAGSDVGFTLRSRVTATNTAGSASATSAPSAVVRVPPSPTSPANSGLPILSGTAQVGQTLASTSGSWSGTTPMTFAYQWQRCDSKGHRCSSLSGAVLPVYTVVSADLGYALRSQVTATNVAGSATATSTHSPVVTAAPAPAPPTTDSQRFGLSGMTWTLASESQADFAKDMGVVDASGAGWLRIDINWAMVQRDGPSSYDWAPFDRIVKDARSRGLDVLGIIDYTPQWARPSPTSDAWTPPRNPSDFGKFAADAARHYGPMVRAYEIWNEPNLGGNWKPAANPAQYTQLLKAAYTSLKSVDPSLIVVSGGLSPATDTSTDRDPRTFLQGMYANGAKGYFDALGHHPYSFPAAPGDAQNWSAWYQMYGAPNNLRSQMVANGDADRKIWATEFGVPTNGPSNTYVSEATQAQTVTKAYDLFKSYSWAGPLFVWSSRDNSTDPSSNYNFYGLIRHDFSAKPALAAYQAAAVAG